jgi:hypothetical protein
LGVLETTFPAAFVALDADDNPYKAIRKLVLRYTILLVLLLCLFLLRWWFLVMVLFLLTLFWTPPPPPPSPPPPLPRFWNKVNKQAADAEKDAAEEVAAMATDAVLDFSFVVVVVLFSHLIYFL